MKTFLCLALLAAPLAAAPLAYVTNEVAGTVTVIDTATFVIAGVAANRANSKMQRPATALVDALDGAVPRMAKGLAARARAGHADADSPGRDRRQAAAL